MLIALLCLKVNISSIGGCSNSIVGHIMDIQVNKKCVNLELSHLRYFGLIEISQIIV